MRDTQGVSLLVSDLSSGERFLVALAILLFNCQQEGRPPKALIMDEPDAHLHPAVIAHVVTAVERAISEEFNCRIVFSTHRPDTVAICNPDEIFEVFSDMLAHPSCTSKAEVIGQLTANLLAVIPNTPCALVEDEHDAALFRVVSSIIVQHCLINLQPLPVFQPVSTGRSTSKVSGSLAASRRALGRKTCQR